MKLLLFILIIALVLGLFMWLLVFSAAHRRNAETQQFLDDEQASELAKMRKK